MSVKNLLIIGTILSVMFFFMGDAISDKYKQVKYERQKEFQVPYSIGSDCIFGDEHVAILNKYIDNDKDLVYDVMVLSDEREIHKLTGIPHILIKSCKE